MANTISERKNTDFLKERDPIFRIIFVLIVAVILGSYTWLITYGSGEFFHEEFLGKAFDSIGKHIIRDDVNIDPDSAKWESFKNHGKLVMYFGPFPGFLRLIPNKIFPQLYGKWSRLSCLLASILSLLAVMLLFATALSRNKALSSFRKKYLFLLSLLAVGLGTPLFFLMQCGFIYHEAHLWGLCWGLWGTAIVFRLVLDEGKRLTNFFLLSCIAGVCLISRVTFAVPFYLFLAFLAVAMLMSPIICIEQGHISWKNDGRFMQVICNTALFKSRLFLTLTLLLLPAILVCLFQSWYNYERFGSILTFADYTRYTAKLDQKQHGIDELGGMMNLSRIPTALYNYVRIRSSHFISHLPYLRLRPVLDFEPGMYPRGFKNGPRMNVISMIIVQPWLLFGAAIGFWYLIRRKYGLLYWLCLAAFFVQVLFVASYYWIATRYTSEFLPILFFLYAVLLMEMGKNGERRFLIKTGVLSLLVLISIITTPLSSMEYLTHYRNGIPQDYRQMLVDTFRSRSCTLDPITKSLMRRGQVMMPNKRKHP